ncbi:MAG: hypothetical protein VXW65_05040, partial [Pseudomonadota bacterium]|nr:hypothetical protein [Pseudomonadota bacterium]
GLLPTEPRQNQAARYVVVDYDPTAEEVAKRWPVAADFVVQELPDQVYWSITPLQSNQPVSQRSPAVWREASTPQLLWFGNGEATPVRLQLLQHNQPIGAAIYVTATGQITEDEQGLTR